LAISPSCCRLPDHQGLDVDCNGLDLSPALFPEVLVRHDYYPRVTGRSALGHTARLSIG